MANENTKRQSRQDNRTRRHHLWQEHVAARADIKPINKLVLLRLGMHHNTKTGRCHPSYSMLAEGAGVSKSTVMRAIAIAEEKGLLTIERSVGRGNANQFRLLLEGKKVSTQTPFS